MGTVRQAVLADAVAAGMSITDAGQLAGYHSVQNASDALQSIRNKMIADLGAVGVGTRALALKIKEKLDAKETKLFQKDGIITDAIDLEAHGVQLHAVELAADILGLRGDKDAAAHIGTVNIMWAGGLPAWAGKANADNCKVTDAEIVKPNNQSVTEPERVPISTVEGTGIGPGPSTHMHSGNSTVLERVNTAKRKRGPRLPVYGGKPKP